MMRGLAEYVMTGRRQAMIAVMLLGLIPLVNLLNPVVVGLIALRKGLQEAGIVFAWAVLPVGAWAVAGDVVPLIMLIGITGLALLDNDITGFCVHEQHRVEKRLLPLGI